MRAERLWRRGLRFPRLFLADRTVLVHGDVDLSTDPRKSRYEARAFDARSLRPLGTAFEAQGPVNLAVAPEGEDWPGTVLVQASRRSVSVRDPRTGSPLLETDLAEPGERWPDDVALRVVDKEAVVFLFGEDGDGGTRWWAVDPYTGATVPDLADSRPGHEARGERMSFAGDYLVAPGQDPGFDPVILADYEHPRERSTAWRTANTWARWRATPTPRRWPPAWAGALCSRSPGACTPCPTWSWSPNSAVRAP